MLIQSPLLEAISEKFKLRKTFHFFVQMFFKRPSNLRRFSNEENIAAQCLTQVHNTDRTFQYTILALNIVSPQDVCGS